MARFMGDDYPTPIVIAVRKPENWLRLIDAETEAGNGVRHDRNERTGRTGGWQFAH